jgi:DNA modification methylase
MIGVIIGDCLDALPAMPAECVQTCVTSPPYFGLRDYGHPDQLGLEATPDEFVAALVRVFREVRRVLRDDGTVWLNLGDSYAGSWGNQGRKAGRGSQRPINGKMLTLVLDGRYPAAESNTGAIPPGASYKPKDLLGIPWMVAFALRADGWYLRSDIIWHKPNPMPESVRDRPTKAHEYLFLLSKSKRYFYDATRSRSRRRMASDSTAATAIQVARSTIAPRRETGAVATRTRHPVATSAPCGPSHRSPSRARTSPRSRRS